MNATQSHDEWEALAAGHALGALEPDDDSQFVAHLAGCARCAGVIDDTRALMAELAYAGPHEEPPADLKARIMEVVDADDHGPSLSLVTDADPQPSAGSSQQPSAQPSRVAVGPRRHRPSFRTLPPMRLAAAASVVLLAVIAAGIWTLALGGSRGGSPGGTAQRPVVVALRAGGHNAGSVEVIGDRTYMIVGDLAPSDPNGQYVLWRLGAGGHPVAVGGFDVTAGSTLVPVASLDVPLSGVSAFAISEEKGHTLPAAPSKVLATGAVSS